MILDKPIAAKIIFSLKNICDSLVDFLGFSTLLYHKNLIFDEPRELRISKNGFFSSLRVSRRHVGDSEGEGLCEKGV